MTSSSSPSIRAHDGATVSREGVACPEDSSTHFRRSQALESIESTSASSSTGILRYLKAIQGIEMADADILNWANNKVNKLGKTSQMESFKDRNISNGIFLIYLLGAVEPRVVDWKLVTKGEEGNINIYVSIMFLVLGEDEDKKLNTNYIISVARRLACSIFLLPEDIIEIS